MYRYIAWTGIPVCGWSGKKKGGGDLFSITFCMCGYPFVFTIILNKMKKNKEFVKCISVKSSMGNSNPCIYLFKAVERYRIYTRSPFSMSSNTSSANTCWKPPAFGSTSSNFNASKLLSSLIEIITHKTPKFPRHECDVRTRRHFVPFVYNKKKAGGLFLE